VTKTSKLNGTGDTARRTNDRAGAFVEKRGYAGAATTVKHPKAPPLVSGQAKLPSATGNPNGQKTGG
jgi:hypothetical protein